ncbi:hypothetical protein BURMUCGD1_2277 [Burkholderia multivorans CGD1]|nr:hypothetical protein BURMUCGD1_2277 [Burkholderia multivorans CGD1]
MEDDCHEGRLIGMAVRGTGGAGRPTAGRPVSTMRSSGRSCTTTDVAA